MFYELSKREIFPELSLGGFIKPLLRGRTFLFILQRQVQTLILISGQTLQLLCCAGLEYICVFVF